MAHHSKGLISTGANALSLDWTVDLSKTAQEIPSEIAIQGNLDPVILNTTPEISAASTRQILDAISQRPGHIFNLGHGILPQARVDCVEAMVHTVTGV